MGHCRYKKIYKFLHSSVAEDVIQLAACPVMVAATDCPEKHSMN
jgi:nucleotide-binding universal stress UspA family protein